MEMDEDEKTMYEECLSEDLINYYTRFFNEADLDGSRDLSYDEFHHLLFIAELGFQGLFYGLPRSDIKNLMYFLDVDEGIIYTYI